MLLIAKKSRIDAGSSSVAENRWHIVIAAVLVQLCFGAIYSWGVFLNPLMVAFNTDKAEVSIIFTLVVIFYTIGMIIGGLWQDQTGPRNVMLVGGLCFGIGYILAGFAGSLQIVYLTYGVLGGLGVGLGYICPIAVCTKWFPDRKGLAVGLAVTGFGAGSLIFSPLANAMITNWDWSLAFRSLGLIFMVIILIASRYLKNPPTGWQSSQVLTTDAGNVGDDILDIKWKQMLKTIDFWMLWIIFCFSASAGLMIIGHMAAFVEEVGFSKENSAFILGIMAVFNGLGRIVWGTFSEKIGRLKSLICIFLQLGLVIAGLIIAKSYLSILLTAVVVGINFGGIISIFPSLTEEKFGAKNLGLNYALLFTAYGIAGIIGPYCGAVVLDRFNNYAIIFAGGALLAMLSALIAHFGLNIKK
ncbi:MAG TPA: OFA family MFS transporter [Bacillota bacterium]|nr:OFA family MFS transporter [Bacillota bacterium]HOL09692.1 OFA family MFS transporter [Bacillota bacterium]HPO97281.1 OFA family MFS transporter [Bacillota bacterium]